MQFLGIVMGLVMIVSVFFKWEMVTGGTGTAKISYFLGIQNNAFFAVAGHRANSLPIILALILIVALILVKYKPCQYVAFLAAVLALGVAGRDVRHLMPLENLKPGIGLWIYAVASALAVISAILLLLKKKSPKAAQAATPAP